MKNKAGYLQTSIWYKEEIKEPIKTLREAFDFATIGYYREMIKNLLLSIYSSEVYNKEEPGNVLFSFAKLESVINASWLLTGRRQIARIADTDNMLARENYCGHNIHTTEWEYLPKALTREEYCDPILAIESFFAFQHINKWKEDLHFILQTALVSYRGEIAVKILPVYIHLVKLLEAAHLVTIR